METCYLAICYLGIWLLNLAIEDWVIADWVIGLFARPIYTRRVRPGLSLIAFMVLMAIAIVGNSARAVSAPTGEISGLILDPDGKPISGAAVSARMPAYVGQRALTFLIGRDATTDARGEYRITGLAPGKYYVWATHNEASSAPTFYPATLDWQNSARVDVGSVTPMVGVDIRLLPTRVARVSGVVRDLAGVARADVAVMLSSLVGDPAQRGAQGSSAPTDASGRFEFLDVRAGHYVVEAFTKERLERIAATGSSPETWDPGETAYVPVEVVDTDVKDLSVTMTPATLLTVRATLDDKAVPAALLRLVKLAIVDLRPATVFANLRTSTPQYGLILPKNSVRAAQGLRKFDLGLPPTVALQAVLVGARDVSDDGLEVGSAAILDVEIQLTSTLTTIGGQVVDEQGQPVGAGEVVVFSTEPKHWTQSSLRRVHSAKVDQHGGFTVKGMPAGSYFAIAVTELPDGEWAEPETLEKWRIQATQFSISNGGSHTLRLPIHDFR